MTWELSGMLSLSGASQVRLSLGNARASHAAGRGPRPLSLRLDTAPNTAPRTARLLVGRVSQAPAVLRAGAAVVSLHRRQQQRWQA